MKDETAEETKTEAVLRRSRSRRRGTLQQSLEHTYDRGTHSTHWHTGMKMEALTDCGSGGR